jgi:hypothetical protein
LEPEKYQNKSIIYIFASMNNTQEPKNANYRKLLGKQKVLAEMGKEYSIKVVNGNYQLISDMFVQKSFNKTDYTPEELRFIKEVRRHVVKNEIHLDPVFQENQYFASDIHYVKVARVPFGEEFDNVCEVDIDQAYWETAFQLGVIDQKIYQKGCKGKISKKARLTALGSLARKSYKYDFKGYKMIDKTVESEPLLENLWFTICKRVSDVMHEVIEALGDDFIFYWVDGIYFQNKPENVSKAMVAFMNRGYQSKFKKINRITFHEKGFTVNDYAEISREFTYPNYNSKGVKIDYAENFKLAKLANGVVNGNRDLVKEIKKEFELDNLDEAAAPEEEQVKEETKKETVKKTTNKAKGGKRKS